MAWTDEELSKIAASDDFRIAPFREDGVTPGTPTFIWSVVADGKLYVRAYNGTNSRWYKSAVQQGAGRITAAGMERQVIFQPVDGEINDTIDNAYREKYSSSRYLDPMISERARAATVRVVAQ